MKISTYIMMLLVISGIFFTFALMTQEAKTYYPEAGIDDSDWADKYDFGTSINRTVSPLQKAFEKLGDEEAGWWTKLTAGITAVPLAIIQIPVVLFQTFVMGGLLITGVFTSLGIPAYLLGIVLIMVLVWGIFKLVEIYQRWQV